MSADKPTDALYEPTMANERRPGFCRPGIGCRYCWADCKWDERHPQPPITPISSSHQPDPEG